MSPERPGRPTVRLWLARGALVSGALLVSVGCSDSPTDPTSTDPPPIATTSTVTTQSGSSSTIDGVSTTTTDPEPTTTTIPLDEISIRLDEVDSGFDNPVLLVAAPDGGADLVIEQPGRIVRIDDSHSVVLDINADVAFRAEQGLLGFAAHPNFAQNNLVYVNYTNNQGDTVIEEFAMTNGTIDVATRTRILLIEQPASNHNGGMIAFGPDGYLWIGMGDGGASNDRFRNGQNADTLLGSMLRIAVGTEQGAYAIPPDNPYANGEGGRPEVWAVGLRNPWRFSFDGGTVWIADVGQEVVEEVNAVPAAEPGLNYGWSIMEGTQCFGASTCPTDGLVLPITEYTHPAGCSITGGYVYTGSRIPSLRGQYFFADYCSGLIRSISIDGVARDWSDMVGTFGSPTGFGVGSDGEMFVVTKQGSLFTIEEADSG